MNLHRMLSQRAEAGRPVRVGVVGAGKFGSMFLAQVPSTPGLEVVAIADLDVERARSACRAVGWSDARIAATAFLEDGVALASDDGLEVLVEATGAPQPAVAHALAAIGAGTHVVMATVEADMLAGAALTRRAEAAGLVYAMAYGDQPALIADMVDWARTCGFEVAAAGKGTKYLPGYHQVTPDEVWTHYGLTPEQAAAAGMNPQMFCSFLDGTKSSIEMAAVANACDLDPPRDGLGFPACGVDDLAHLLRPKRDGGALDDGAPGRGSVEVVSSVERDGQPVFRDLRWGVYVVMRAPSHYAAACFSQYGLPTDDSGRYAALYRPFHMIGLEIGVSVAAAAVRGEATGAPRAFRADVAAVAKRALKAGERLDGEGGRTVWGKLMPAASSVAVDAVPIGFAHGVALARDVAEGAVLTFGDLVERPSGPAAALRAELIATLGAERTS